MFIGKIGKIFDYDKWLVNANNDKKSRGIEIGEFVKTESNFIGVIIGNHQDIPEDYLGKTISGEVSESLFIDDFEEEKVFYSVLGLGTLNKEGFGLKKPPSLKEDVFVLDKDSVQEFHRVNGEFRFNYYNDIIEFEKIEPETLVLVLEKLEDVFEGHESEKKLLKALKKLTRRK